jgi:hypothetical protein
MMYCNRLESVNQYFTFQKSQSLSLSCSDLLNPDTVSKHFSDSVRKCHRSRNHRGLRGRKEVQWRILQRKLCASVGGGEPVIVPPRKVIEVVKEEFFKGIGFWRLSLFLLLWLLDANSPSIVLILHFSMPQLLDHTYAIYYPSNIQDLISLQIYENHEVFQHIYFHINLNIN